MKKLKLSIYIFLLIIFVLIFSTRIIQENYKAQERQSLVVELQFYGIEEYFLFENFGEDISLWSNDQVETAQEYLNCIDEWWSVSTEEQKDNMSRSLVAWICWRNYNE